jgi:hypothetical protein
MTEQKAKIAQSKKDRQMKTLVTGYSYGMKLENGDLLVRSQYGNEYLAETNWRIIRGLRVIRSLALGGPEALSYHEIEADEIIPLTDDEGEKLNKTRAQIGAPNFENLGAIYLGISHPHTVAIWERRAEYRRENKCGNREFGAIVY